MKKFIYLFFIVILSCEKDDICPETTQTTSRMVIEFYDLTNPDQLLEVPGLFALGLNSEGIEIPINNEIVTTRSSIALPLKTDETETEFNLYKNYDIVDGTVIGNPDTIKVTYSPENVYVSRSCGFKTIFDIQTFSITSDSDQWMISSDTLISTITNENDIHIKILH
jgi:hypothetical protein